MKFPCHVRQDAGGWTAEHRGAAVGQVAARGGTREEALEKLVGEIRYRLELCPCSGDSYQHVEVEIVVGDEHSKP